MDGVKGRAFVICAYSKTEGMLIHKNKMVIVQYRILEEM